MLRSTWKQKNNFSTVAAADKRARFTLLDGGERSKNGKTKYDVSFFFSEIEPNQSSDTRLS
jgi:hypothetical protein